MNIELNKGNYTYLEPEERINAFHQARAFGNEDAYYKYRKQWEEAAHGTDTREYPVHVDLELSTVCNLHCPFCYTITEEFKQQVSRQFMDFDLYKKIIDEIAGKVPSVRLSLRGETTLHPQLLECIHYAKRKGIVEVSFLTNLSKMTPDFFEKILLAGLDWMTISFDGLGEEYEKNRSPLKYLDSYEKLKAIKQIKERYYSPKPVITVQSIWPSIENNPQEYYDIISRVCDQVAFNPLQDFSQHTSYKKLDKIICQHIYQRIVIYADGKAAVCPNDEYESMPPAGDTNIQSIYDIWNGLAFKKVREIHAHSGYQSIDACTHCAMGIKTDFCDILINGRNVKIPYYVKDSQQ